MKIFKKDLFFLLIAELTVLYNFIINRNYFFDDTLIYARYIKNFNNGLGLVYNEGEYYNGLTSPLFTYLNLFITSIIPVSNQILLNNIIGWAFISLSIIVIYLILRKLKYDTTVIGVIVILYSISNIYMFLGLETSLYIFLTFLLFYFFFIRKYFLYFIICALLFITRSEGAFFILTTVILFFFERREIKKVFIPYILLSALILFLHFGFNLYYYGHIFPDSANAKIYHGISKLWGSRSDFIKKAIGFLTYDYELRGLFRYLYYCLLIFFPICIIVKKKNTFDYYLLISNFFLLVFYLYFNVPLYLWYISPLIFTKIYFIVFGLDFFIQHKSIPKKTKVVNLGILIFLSFAFNYNSNFKDENTKANQQRERDYMEIVKWINKNTKSNESIGTAEVGIIGYYTNRKIIDLCGLVTENNAFYLSKKDIDSWINEHHPTYILFHNPLWDSLETNIGQKHKNYKILDNFDFKGYKMYKKID